MSLTLTQHQYTLWMAVTAKEATIRAQIKNTPDGDEKNELLRQCDILKKRSLDLFTETHGPIDSGDSVSIEYMKNIMEL